MAQVWVKTNRGDIMRLGDAQKARKADGALSYEVVGEGDGAGREAGSAADPRLDADSGEVQGAAIGTGLELGREPIGGEHPAKAMGGVGEETRRKAGRPRRNA